MRYEITVKTPCLRNFLLFLKHKQKSSRLIKLQNSFRGNIRKSNICTILCFGINLNVSESNIMIY